MKVVKGILLLFVWGAIVNSCGSMQKTKSTLVNKILEDHESATYQFPEGVYYRFLFEGDKPAYDFDETVLVEKLVERKIPVRNMWYKRASSSCVAPGSSMAMTVIVEPVLIIQLNEANDRLDELNFTAIASPAMGTCAYRVVRYAFANQ